MLGHQGEAEPRPVARPPLAGLPAAVEPVEDVRGPSGGPVSAPYSVTSPGSASGPRREAVPCSTTTRVTPPAYRVAFSTRLVTTRSKRRLSIRIRRFSTPGATWTAMSEGRRFPAESTATVEATACRTSSAGLTSSSDSSADPASNREISSRSSTMRRNRCRSPSSRVRARRARGVSSALWVSSTLTEADRVVRGERSSWLTSDVNRASRSIRFWRLAAIRLNEVARSRRSGSPPVSTRVSSWPPAIETAASEIPARGSRARPAAHRPTMAPATVVKRAPAARAMARDRRVLASSSRENTSK